MAIAYTNSVADTSPATTTAIDPAATALDVILNAAVSDGTDTTAATWPTSFDNLLGPQSTTTDNQVSRLSRKKSASGAEGSLTSTFPDNNIGLMISFSGCDNTTPEDVASVLTNQNTGANPRTLTASITPTTDGCEIVMFAFGDIQSGADVTFTFTESGTSTLGSITKRQDITSGFYNMAVAHASQATAGLCTVQVSGAGSANMGMCLMLVALRPASGGSSAAASAAGTTTVTVMVGSASQSAGGSAAGTTPVAIMVGRGTQAAPASAAGTSPTVVAVGTATGSAVMNGAGTSTAEAVGTSTVASGSDASAAGTSTAIAVGRASQGAVMIASGASTAIAVGSSTGGGNTVVTLGAKPNPWKVKKDQAQRQQAVSTNDDHEELMGIIRGAMPYLARAA